jgi:hypothetical protein
MSDGRPASVKLRLLAGAFLVSATVAAHAQSPASYDPATLDPSIMLVVSGGRWESGAQRGGFRLVMLRGDAGPTHRRLVVQWLEEQPAAGRVVVRSSQAADSIPLGSWVLGVPRLELRNGRWYAVVVGTTDGGRIRRTWRFALDVPGKLREVQVP